MKNIFKTFLIGLVLLVGFTSCEESDLAIDNLYNNVDTSGAILRILEYPADLVNVSGGSVPNSIDFLVEVQEGDGSSYPDFKEVRVYLSSFDDQDLINPTTDADGNEVGEVFFRTISAAEFEELSEINGLPEYQIITPTSLLGDEIFPTAVFTVPSFIVTRFELEMNDGRIFNDESAGTSLSGPYFESPFIHKTIFINN